MLGIDLRAGIMTLGLWPRAIMAALRPISRPYHYKQPLFINWLLYFNLFPRFNQAIMGFTIGHYGFY